MQAFSTVVTPHTLWHCAIDYGHDYHSVLLHLRSLTGNGIGNGNKAWLLVALRGAVAIHAWYCQDNLPTSKLCDLALKTAEVMQTFVQTLFAHIDDEVSMLTEMGLSHKKVMLSVSNQVMQIFDDCFEFSQLAMNVDSNNKPATAIWYGWVALQCCTKQLEYLQAHIKQHPSIMNLFLRFLTRATAESASSSLAKKLEDVMKELKTLRDAKGDYAKSKELTGLDNKLEGLIQKNNLVRE